MTQPSIKEVIQALRFVGGNYDLLANRIEAHGIAPPDGMVLVPIRPTWEIENAIANSRNLSAKESWADALAAAPKGVSDEQ